MPEGNLESVSENNLDRFFPKLFHESKATDQGTDGRIAVVDARARTFRIFALSFFSRLKILNFGSGGDFSYFELGPAAVVALV